MDEDEDEDPAGAGIDDEEQESVPAIYTTARDPKKLYLDKVHEQLLKVAHKWNVSLKEGRDYGVYQFLGKQSTRCGNRPIEPATKRNNEQMNKCTARLGDSAL
jgi:hypothetical protein